MEVKNELKITGFLVVFLLEILIIISANTNKKSLKNQQV